MKKAAYEKNTSKIIESLEKGMVVSNENYPCQDNFKRGFDGYQGSSSYVENLKNRKNFTKKINKDQFLNLED